MSDSDVPAQAEIEEQQQQSGLEYLHAIEHPKKKAFLWAVVETGGSIRRAAELAQVSYTTHYNWLRQDSAYLKAYRVADKLAGDTLVDHVVERATRRKKPSDLLLMFATKAKRPEYRDNFQMNIDNRKVVLLDRSTFDFDKYKSVLINEIRK
jgi:transposase